MSHNATPIACPTPQQVEWADTEVGVIIHFDMQVFEPGYEFRNSWGYSPDLSKFNPSNLDTDQWIETAKNAGAKYAILVAKHCSGFALWPTEAYDYHIGNTPWKDGKGNIVADFFASCKKYGLKPGVYCSSSCNGYMMADNPGKIIVNDPEFLHKYNTNRNMQSGKESIWAPEDKQREYNKAVETQLTELWSDYGKLFEIWFDGGVLPYEDGGPNIIPLLNKLQPDAVVMGGPVECKSLARFVGNERAEPEDPFWSTTNDLTAFDGTTEVTGLNGNPDGDRWSPGESDMPNRDQSKALQGGWFWRAGEDKSLYSVDHLVECYMRSVGKNTNYLLGMVIDNRGMVPEADQAQFAEFGERIKQIFSNKITAELRADGECYTLELPEEQAVNMLSLQENIEHGERIRKFIVEAMVDGEWLTVCRGTCMGHKRLERFSTVKTSMLRLTILEAAGEFFIRNFEVWNVNPELFSVPLNIAERNLPRITKTKDDMVIMECKDPNLLVRYTLDGTDPDSSSPVYEKPFLLKDVAQVKAYSFVNDKSHSPIVSATFGIDKSSWSVENVSLDSPFVNNGHAGVSQLLNDDPHYYWHTYHTDKEVSKCPHEVVINMNETKLVESFTLTIPDVEGSPDECEFYLSDNCETWTLVASVKLGFREYPWQGNITLAKPASGRFMRLVVKNCLKDVDYVKLAGIGVVPVIAETLNA